MKKNISLTILLVLMTFLGCNREGKSIRHQGDLGNTPYQYDSIFLTYGSDPERALVLLDSAVLLGNLNDYEEQIARATIYSKSLEEQQQDSALHICEALLEHDSVIHSTDQHEAVLDLLIGISRAKADDNEYLRWAIQKADLLRAQDEEVELLRVEAEIGLVMTHLARVEEGIAKLDNCIQQLDKPGSIDRLDAFIIAAKRKITVLNEQNRYAEVIPLCQRILDRLQHYEQNASDYAEDSYRLSWSEDPADRDRYLDFYRAQANGFMAAAYAQTGHVQQAREHLQAFDGSGYGQTFSARRMIIPAQMALGLYDEAMATCDQMVERMGSDTINYNYAVILHDRAHAARSKGKSEEAFDLLNRYARLSKVLSDSLHQSQAHDYAARYHDKEQQLKIHDAESKRQQLSIVLLAIIVLFIITTIAAIFFYRQRQHIIHKNRALVKMINRNKQLQIEDDSDDDSDDDSVDDSADDVVEQSATDGATGLMDAEKRTAGQNEQLFSTIDATIREERLYCNVNLQRQDICERFGISRFMLNNLLLTYRGNASLPKYINSIRMEVAVRMLREEPDVPITIIAERVGFSVPNFRRQFINNFGMTPAEFRKNQ